MERLWNRNDFSWIIGGMLGASFVAITQLATRSDLNESHVKSLGCFAAALPLLMDCFFTIRQPNPIPEGRRGVIVAFGVIAGVLFIMGLGFLLRSFGHRVYSMFFAGVVLSSAGALLVAFRLGRRK